MKLSVVIVFALLFVQTLFLAWLLEPSWHYTGFAGPNDLRAHFVYVSVFLDAFKNGSLGLDAWNSYLVFGAPVFRVYQNLSHFLAAGLCLLFKTEDSLRIVYGMMAFFVTLQPICFYIAARRMGMTRAISLFASTLCLLVHSIVSLGNEIQSYWYYGVFTQAIAIPFFVVGLSSIVRALCSDKDRVSLRWLDAVTIGAWIGVTFITHHFLGYMLLVCWGSLCVLVVAEERKSIIPIIKMSANVLAVSGMIASYQLFSIYQDYSVLNIAKIHNPNQDGYGMSYLMTALFTGQLFDYKRFPFLTILIALSVARVFRQTSTRVERALALWIVLGILICAGPTTFGTLFSLIPGIGFVHLPRFMALVEVSAVFLSSILLGELWSRTKWSNLGYVGGWILVVAGYYLAESDVIDVAGIVAGKLRTRAEQSALFDRNLFWSLSEPLASGYLWMSVNPMGKSPANIYLPSIANSLGYRQVRYFDKPEFFTSVFLSKINPNRKAQIELLGIAGVMLPTEEGTKESFLKVKHQTESLSAFTTSATGLWDVVGIDRVNIANDNLDYKRQILSWLENPKLSAHTLPAIIPKSVAEKWPSAISNPAEGRSAENWGKVIHSSSKTAVLKADRQGAMGMFRSSYHPRWKIIVNGKQVPPRYIGPGFVGFDLSAGTNECSISFPSDPLRSFLFVFGMVLLGLCLGLESWRAFKTTRSIVTSID